MLFTDCEIGQCFRRLNEQFPIFLRVRRREIKFLPSRSPCRQSFSTEKQVFVWEQIPCYRTLWKLPFRLPGVHVSLRHNFHPAGCFTRAFQATHCTTLLHYSTALQSFTQPPHTAFHTTWWGHIGGEVHLGSGVYIPTPPPRCPPLPPGYLPYCTGEPHPSSTHCLSPFETRPHWEGKRGSLETSDSLIARQIATLEAD